MEEAGRRGGPRGSHAPVEEVLTAQDRSNKRDEDSRPDQAYPTVLCGAKVPQERAPRGNMARQLSVAVPKAESFFFFRRRVYPGHVIGGDGETESGI